MNGFMKKCCKEVSLLKPFKVSNYQYFLQWFCEACEDSGFCTVKPFKIPWKVRLIIAKLCLSFRLPEFLCSKEKIIVLGGGYPDSFAFPYAYNQEIIPVLWDTWPRYHKRLIKSFVRHKVKLAFFTQRQVAEFVHEKLPSVKCVWLPEGINCDVYHRGDLLKNRNVDLLELGRLMPRFHDAVVGGMFCHKFKDPKDGLLYADFNALRQGLADAKITVCFPRCDTHPEMAGNIETLTQRYWECMLSRTVILGRSPKELIDLIGYDPCIPVDWNNVNGQVQDIISDIQSNDKYQMIVDRNYQTAKKMASWNSRMGLLEDNIRGILDDL